MSDRFTLDMVAAGLDAASTEMFDVLRKTAMSPIIYEVLDVGTGITDANGALVSSGAGIPSFVSVLDKSVVAIRDKIEDTIAELPEMLSGCKLPMAVLADIHKIDTPD